MRKVTAIVCTLATAVLLAACGGSDAPPGGPGGPGGAEIPDDGYGPVDPADPGANGPIGKQNAQQGDDRFSALKVLRKYVTNKDGSLTRAELETGLKADFDAADTNHNGKLEPDEMRAVNHQRWLEQGAASSPLTDWNGDGLVDFDEFAGMARSLFVQLDADHNGVLSSVELRQLPKKPETEKQQDAPKGKSGPRGGGSGGPPGGGGRGGGQGGPGGGPGG
jgi:hypothetical protein